MRNRHGALALFLLLAPCSVAGVLNVDFETTVTDTAHDLGDGALSSSCGEFWNAVVHDQFDGPAWFFRHDESGRKTVVFIEVDQSLTAPGTDPAATNDLQSTGLAGNGFTVMNLVAGTPYDLAVYVGPGTGFLITDATGTHFGGSSGTGQSYVLPGTPGEDYVLITAVEPFDTGKTIQPGNVPVYGIRIESVDGLVTGIQISGDLPLFERPTCNIELSQAIYTGDEMVTATTFGAAYSGSMQLPLAIEWKVWLEWGASAWSVINVGWDRSFGLLPMNNGDIELGPLDLVPASVLPTGFYRLNSRLLDPVSGETLCEDFNPFEVE